MCIHAMDEVLKKNLTSENNLIVWKSQSTCLLILWNIYDNENKTIFIDKLYVLSYKLLIQLYNIQMYTLIKTKTLYWRIIILYEWIFILTNLQTYIVYNLINYYYLLYFNNAL